MLKKSSPLLLFIALTLLGISIAACGGAAPAAPTRAPVAPTVAAVATRASAPASPTAAAATSAPVQPTRAPAPTQAASPTTSASAGYDGDWSGATNPHDMPIAFTVESNQLTNVDLGYAVQTGSCTVSGSQSQDTQARIGGKAFNVQFTDDNNYQYIFTGAFTANTQANGTLDVKGTSALCGAFEAKLTWKATIGAASSSAPTVSDATPTTGIADTDVLLAFFKAVNAKKLDDALALVDDQVVFNIAGTPGIGKDALKAYLQNQMSRNVTFTASNLTSNDTVTVHFTLRTSDKSAPVDDDTALVGDNVLQTLVLH